MKAFIDEDGDFNLTYDYLIDLAAENASEKLDSIMSTYSIILSSVMKTVNDMTLAREVVSMNLEPYEANN